MPGKRKRGKDNAVAVQVRTEQESPLDTEFVQSHSCNDRNKYPLGNLPSRCMVCEDRLQERCRFQGIRVLKRLSKEPYKLVGFTSGDVAPFSFPYHDNLHGAPATLDTSRDLQYCVAVELKSVLEQELQAMKSGSSYISKAPNRTQRITCDVCQSHVLFVTYMCTNCAMELCISCGLNPNPGNSRPSCPHAFQPCTTVTEQHIQNQQNLVAAVCDSNRIVRAPRPTNAAKQCKLQADLLRHVPTIAASQFDAFISLWTDGYPVVVISGSHIRGKWTPAYLDALYGGKTVSVIRVADGDGEVTTPYMKLSEFFRLFTSNNNKDMLKVKDFPPKKDMDKECPDLFNNFVDSLPFRSHSGPDGYFNVAAHYAKNHHEYQVFKPDLGPKCYLATADSKNVGSTNLHLDRTSAANVCFHAEDITKGAMWTIFRREDTSGLQKYLAEKYPEIPGNAIHSHSVFLKDADFISLRAKKIYPFRFEQRIGETVFIPAGCAHQVSNRTSCFKVAVDFMDRASLEESIKLCREFRERREVDLLQTRWTLYHAWMSLSELIDSAGRSASSISLNVAEKKKAQKQRQRQGQTGRFDHRRRQHLKKSAQEAAVRKLSASSTGGAGNAAPVSTPEKAVRACPHPECKAGHVFPFTMEAIWKHMFRTHGIDLPWSARRELLDTPASEWPQTFASLVKDLNGHTA